MKIRDRETPALSFLLILTLPIGMTMASAAMAAGQDHGRVSMKGSIIDSACAIATQDREQTVEMGADTLGEMVHNQRGQERPFSIHLVNCSLTPAGQKDPRGGWPQFQVTFDGPAADGLFSVNGASGIGIQIVDTEGHIAVPGAAMPAVGLLAGAPRLDYALRLVGNRQRLKAGDYRSTIRFKIDYY